MEQKVVAHFIRKSSHLRASFIKNQIENHIDYKPVVIYKFKVESENDGGFAEFNNKDIPVLNLSDNETFTDKIVFKLFKRISKRQAKLIRKFFTDSKVSMLHFHYGSDAGIYVSFLKRTKLPSVVSFYGYDCSGFPNWFGGLGKWWLKSRVFRYITKALAMSPDMKKDIIATGCPEEKVIVHYYGTDVYKFYHPDREYKQNATTTFLILASLVPQKGHLFLLKSFKKVKEAGISNFKLRIVGTGALEEKLKTYVRENELGEHVVFTGAIKYASPEMHEEYQKADVFVHPSITDVNGDKEGIPGTIIEAMSAGLPVISTYHAGIPYIIEHQKTGLLASEWDVDQLADNIIKLINSPELREQTGKAGQKYVMQNLDLKEKEIELEKIYSTL